jgi:hypothetical protein
VTAHDRRNSSGHTFLSGAYCYWLLVDYFNGSLDNWVPPVATLLLPGPLTALPTHLLAARGTPLFASPNMEKPIGTEEAATPDSKRPLHSVSWGQRLQRTPSLDTPSERSAKERHSLERVLEEEGAVLLGNTPELRLRDVPLLITADPQSVPEVDEAATSPLGWSAHLTWTAAAEARGTGGQPQGARDRLAVHGGERGLELAGVGEGAPSGDARQASRLRTPLAALASRRGEAAEGPPEDAEEALLNSISLTQLYLGERFASGTYGRLYTGIFQGQVTTLPAAMPRDASMLGTCTSPSMRVRLQGSGAATCNGRGCVSFSNEQPGRVRLTLFPSPFRTLPSRSCGLPRLSRRGRT